MEPTDITVSLLRDIRDEMRTGFSALTERVDGLNERVDGLNERVDGLNERVDRLDERMDRNERRIVDAELRTATAITELHGAVRDLTQVLMADRDLRGRVTRCEQQIEDIKGRLA